MQFFFCILRRNYTWFDKNRPLDRLCLYPKYSDEYKWCRCEFCWILHSNPTKTNILWTLRLTSSVPCPSRIIRMAFNKTAHSAHNNGRWFFSQAFVSNSEHNRNSTSSQIILWCILWIYLYYLLLFFLLEETNSSQSPFFAVFYNCLYFFLLKQQKDRNQIVIGQLIAWLRNSN